MVGGHFIQPLTVDLFHASQLYLHVKSSGSLSSRTRTFSDTVSSSPYLFCSRPLGHGFLAGKWKSYNDLERAWFRCVA